MQKNHIPPTNPSGTHMPNIEVDVIVVGAGLVGASCAIALAQQGRRVLMLDSHPRKEDAADLQSADWHSRIYAISPGNVAWLSQLGVWQHVNQQRICEVHSMQIEHDQGGQDKPPAASLRFSAEEANMARLGLMVEHVQLMHALRLRLSQIDVQIIPVSHANAFASGTLDLSANQANIHLPDGRSVSGKLVIAADGANSTLRQQAGIPVQVQAYGQMGVVANFTTSLPHHNIARQWFREDGVLALLPLAGQRVSMVWSTADDNARYLLDLPPSVLCEALEQASKHVYGAMQLIHQASAFPLQLQTVGQLVKPRLALVGDAAHVIHPLAGQGVNLGFRDVIALAQTLAAKSSYQDIGDVILLRTYERARKTDMALMRYTTHGLQRLFASQNPVLKNLRQWGLQLTNQQQALKKRLIKHAVY